MRRRESLGLLIASTGTLIMVTASIADSTIGLLLGAVVAMFGARLAIGIAYPR